MNSLIQVAAKNNRISNILQETGNLIIAGPCSAESQGQVLETAMALAADGRTHFLRAGIWKPRTAPGSFEGVGSRGFEWLKHARAVTGLPIATEVSSERHVYEALKHGVDLLWIGARTVSNPFTIQEIAEAIRGVDIPVLVKNPLCPEINLWEGAINRFARVGITQLGAIHRGFSHWGKLSLRNDPNWAIPTMLRERMPELPIICDPSHIAGKNHLVPLIAQRAVQSGFNGLMVEVHNNPGVALSDAAQQLLPQQFEMMLDRLFNATPDQSPEELLMELRLEVDIFDEQLVSALANRMELVKQIALIKKKNKMEVFQASRWRKITQKVETMAFEHGLRPSFIKKVFSNIHRESCNFQEEQILNLK